MKVLLYLFCCFTLSILIRSELLQTQVFMHHGSKVVNKLSKFPSDPPNFPTTINSSYEDFELSYDGKWTAYGVGENFRAVYGQLLDYKYAPSKVRVISRFIDRSINSAQLAMAGFLPPVDEQIWNPNLPWQPVPVITDIAFQFASEGGTVCPALVKSIYNHGKQRIVMYSEIASDLSRKTGREINNLYDLTDVIGAVLGRFAAPPAWLTPKYREKLESEYARSTIDLYEPTIPIVGGWHYDQIVSGMSGFIQNKTSHKFILYSGHEVDPIILTEYMKIQIHWAQLPRTSSYFAIELHREHGEHRVKIFRHGEVNGTREELFLSECPAPCSFDKFSKLLQGISSNNWLSICMGKDVEVTEQPFSNFFLIIGGIVLILVAAGLIYFAKNKCCKRVDNGEMKHLL